MPTTTVTGTQIRDETVEAADLASGSIMAGEMNAQAIAGQTLITEPSGDNDRLLIWDATDSSLRKVAPDNLFTEYDTRIGIGTGEDAPDNTLHVKSPETCHIKIESEAGHEAALKIKSGGQSSAYIWQPGNTSDLRFYINGKDVMHLDNDGNVGIGTTAPDSKLHVAGTVHISGSSGSELLRLAKGGAQTREIVFENDGVDVASIFCNAAESLRIKNEVNNGDIVFQLTNGNSVSNFLFLDGGNLRCGIGSSNPADTLEIDAGAADTKMRLETDDGYDIVYSGYQSTTQKLTMGYDDSTDVVTLNYGGLASAHLCIDSTGKIGVGTVSPTSTFEVAGSVATAISTKTVDYIAGAGDHTLMLNATSGNLTITLPAASTATGRIYVFKRIDNSGNTVGVNRNGADTIDGGNVNIVLSPDQGVILQCMGTGWIKIGEYVAPP